MLRYRPIVRMYSVRPLSPSARICAGVLATRNSRRVALLTPTSVACADSSTAVSSSNTVVYSSSVAGCGLAARKVAKNGSMSARFKAGAPLWPAPAPRRRSPACVRCRPPAGRPAKRRAAARRAAPWQRRMRGLRRTRQGRQCWQGPPGRRGRRRPQLQPRSRRRTAPGGAHSVRAPRPPARAPGLPAGARAAGADERDAVDRADRQAQLAAGAGGLDHRVHALRRTDDAVDRAGLDAQRAADAPGLVDDRERRGPSAPKAGFSGSAGRPLSAASRAMPSAPPGGHWLISASPPAIASA